MNRRAVRQKVYTTTVNDVTIKGFSNQIATECLTLGREAQRNRDETAAQRFFQTAEHYRKIANNGTNTE